MTRRIAQAPTKSAVANLMAKEVLRLQGKGINLNSAIKMAAKKYDSLAQKAWNGNNTRHLAGVRVIVPRSPKPGFLSSIFKSRRVANSSSKYRASSSPKSPSGCMGGRGRSRKCASMYPIAF